MMHTETATLNARLTNRPVFVKRLAIGIGITLGVIAALVITSAFLATVVWNGLEAGQPAPTFNGNDLNGNPIHLAAYAGKPVMLTFWSPDCSACREELPALQAIANDPNANVTLVTVVSKLSVAEVRQFMAANKLTFPVLVDEPGGIATAYEITGVPISYFINPDGTIDHSIVGAGSKGALENNLFAWLKTCDLAEVCK